MENNHPAIRTTGLSRLFPGGQGVRDLALEVPAGSIYGFLGPNGAGKTTSIRLLLGLLHPAEGSIDIFGQRLDGRRQALRQVGALAFLAFLALVPLGGWTLMLLRPGFGIAGMPDCEFA